MMLTMAVVAVGVISVSIFAVTQYQYAMESYQGNIVYSIQRMPVLYDYSCDENIYEIGLSVLNNGTKLVTGLSFSISNAICVGSVSNYSSTLDPRQSMTVDLYSSVQNGTITVTGNNTILLVHF